MYILMTVLSSSLVEDIGENNWFHIRWQTSVIQFRYGMIYNSQIKPNSLLLHNNYIAEIINKQQN